MGRSVDPPVDLEGRGNLSGVLSLDVGITTPREIGARNDRLAILPPTRPEMYFCPDISGRSLPDGGTSSGLPYTVSTYLNLWCSTDAYCFTRPCVGFVAERLAMISEVKSTKYQLFI